MGHTPNFNRQNSIWLQALRRARNISQQEMAQRLMIKQAAISKMERRDDICLSSLRKYVAALGGHLEIAVRFPEQSLAYTLDSDFSSPIPPTVAGAVSADWPLVAGDVASPRVADA